LDTTSYILEIDCEISGIPERHQESCWTIFPNPASEYIALKFTKHSAQESIQIYNVIGGLVKTLNANSAETNINIADLPAGIYYVRLKNNTQSAVKFIKL
jgi:hypothetical protein